MHQPVKEALEQVKKSGKLFLELFGYGDLSVEVYKPVGQDFQKPHERDEIYFIIEGAGQFYLEGKQHFFQPGDFFFVPAGADHRFQDFTDDFATWVIFFGPKGGSFPAESLN